ncbi:hypothetical protein EV207_11583 [Scopulibacillus darangshiensis]|uniref:Acetyltransferase (GNAT) family protein n=1 Tax=Scopulibacillus darangshiensis TaxID=442528 RepID=A0A4R2P2P6_9BACL|nr:hypothetical protein [Scopulibacillus darangshiensis]TCP28847.1 hypothetical protein EV207_11583 [Scopulibacillus darangshiensis]
MDPILFEIPTVLETERLILKMPSPGDGEVVNAAIKASLTELKPWLGFAQNTPTVNETEVNTRVAHAKFLKREGLRLLIFHDSHSIIRLIV